MKKRKITASERQILTRLIYPESYGVILEETGLQSGELRDDLINLISFGYIEAYEQDESHIALTHFYDTDNLQDFTFRATKKGLSQIKLSQS